MGKSLPELKITYDKNRMKQHNMVITSLGACLKGNLNAESMAMKSLEKINTKL